MPLYSSRIGFCSSRKTGLALANAGVIRTPLSSKPPTRLDLIAGLFPDIYELMFERADCLSILSTNAD